MATHHRPLSLEPHGVENTIQDGDSSVHLSVCPQRGLDGLPRPPGYVSTDSSPSGIPEVSSVRSIQEGLPIQDSLFWSRHGSLSLHAGHGSGFGNPSQSWHSAPLLSGDRRQLGEISACSDSNYLLSGGSSGFHHFPGFSRPETDRQATLNWRRISVLRGSACKILARVAGVLSSLTQLILGGRLRTRSFQLLLHHHWDREDPDAIVRWSPEVHQDLLWWLHRARLECGISLEQVSPQLDLWSDASDVGWGAHLGDQVVSGRWSPVESQSSINHQELLAIFYALQHFFPPVRNTAVALYADNTTALAYLRHQGGTRSVTLNQMAQDLLCWAEANSITLLPQFIMGRNNVLADALSRPHQILGSEWTLKLSVFNQLRSRWPVMIDLFATSLNHRCTPYFSPFHDPNSIGTDALLQRWDGWQAYAFPPYALIPAVLKKIRSSSGVLLTIIAPYWPQRPWFPELLELVVDGLVALPLDRNLLSQPHIHRQHLGLSRLALHAWRLSSDL